MQKISNNQNKCLGHQLATSIVIINFFKSAQDLSQEEFEQVVAALVSKEARVRFTQQRRYGKRTFLQEGVDNSDGLSDRQDEQRKHGLPITGKKNSGLIHIPNRLMSLPQTTQNTLMHDGTRTSNQSPDNRLNSLQRLRGDKESFLETLKYFC